MAQEKTLEKKVVLYHGSLEELNSRNPNEQYRFAKELSFRSDLYIDSDNLANMIAENIRNHGWDGIVNRKTTSILYGTIMPSSYVVIEGTPVVRVEFDENSKEKQ